MNENRNCYLRDAVGNAILNIGEKNKKIVLVSANVMSSCRVREAIDKYPERVFEVGIAEQDMISFAAGLSKEGFNVYTFTMAPFMSMRACEQVRTDISYNNLNVKMIAPYAGVSGGISGATHWAIEDCAIMSGIPGITILEPSDPLQAKMMIEETENYQGAIYMRIGIEPVFHIYNDNYNYQIGKADYVRNGEDGTFICSGVTVKYAIEAADRIRVEYGKNIRVIDMHTIKPIDKDAVIKAIRTENIIVAQDHNVVGGLGYMVANVIAESGCGVNFKILGIPDEFVTMAHAQFLYHKYGYDADGMYWEMKKMLKIE